jgi:hypothetical protein
MWRAMFWKESRECGVIVGLAAVVLFDIFQGAMGRSLVLGFSSDAIPFLDGKLEFAYGGTLLLAAGCLGGSQTLLESWRQTWVFLLHRPETRTRLFQAKLLSGGLLVFLLGGVPLLWYALWAATPGTHPSPFEWSMVEPWCRTFATGLLAYLALFYTGLRPARWFGSRLLPAVTVLGLGVTLRYLPAPWWLVCMLYALLIGALLLLIHEEARLREYP